LDNQNITIISRRMVRDYKISELRRAVGKLGGNPKLIKTDEVLVIQNPNQNSTPPSPSPLIDTNVSIVGQLKNNGSGYSPENVKRIISYLNKKTGKNFKPSTKATVNHIKARFNENFKLEDFKTVIDNQTAKWNSDPKMVDYLRPETLFGTKFESYLQTKPPIPETRYEAVE